MTEKMNRHTDPTGLLASAKAANDGRPYLGDTAVVERMLRHFIAEILTRYDEVGSGVLTPVEASRADQIGCLNLASIFCGDNPAYAPVKGWTGSQMADHLRQKMARDLQPEEDDTKLVAQALAVMVHHVYDSLRSLAAAGADGETTQAIQQNIVACAHSMARALIGAVGND